MMSPSLPSLFSAGGMPMNSSGRLVADDLGVDWLALCGGQLARRLRQSGEWVGIVTDASRSAVLPAAATCRRALAGRERGGWFHSMLERAKMEP